MGLSDFVGVAIGLGFTTVGLEGGLPGCDFLLNLRHFKSEALVLGNWVAACFNGEAEEGPMVCEELWATVVVLEGVSFGGLCFWFVGVSGMPEMRRFFWVWGLFALPDIGDITDLEVDREDEGP